MARLREEPGVKAILPNELIMRAALDYPAPIEHDDLLALAGEFVGGRQAGDAAPTIIVSALAFCFSRGASPATATSIQRDRLRSSPAFIICSCYPEASGGTGRGGFRSGFRPFCSSHKGPFRAAELNPSVSRGKRKLAAA